jgi:hypothetical protein
MPSRRTFLKQVSMTGAALAASRWPALAQSGPSVARVYIDPAQKIASLD